MEDLEHLLLVIGFQEQNANDCEPHALASETKKIVSPLGFSCYLLYIVSEGIANSSVVIDRR